MKKIITVVLLVLLLAFTASVAYAQETETQITELAKANEKVIKAVCIVYQRNCIVAIQTEKFATRSEYDAYRKNLTEQIKKNYQIDNVYITRNPKIMAKMEQLSVLSEDERNKAIEEIINNELRRFKPPFDKTKLPQPKY